MFTVQSQSCVEEPGACDHLYLLPVDACARVLCGLHTNAHINYSLNHCFIYLFIYFKTQRFHDQHPCLSRKTPPELQYEQSGHPGVSHQQNSVSRLVTTCQISSLPPQASCWATFSPSCSSSHTPLSADEHHPNATW